MDCKVETTEDSILQYVTNPEEGIIEFSGRVEEQHFVKLASNSYNIGTIKNLEAGEIDFIEGVEDENDKQSMMNDLKKDSWKFRNVFISYISAAIQDLGIMSFKLMRHALKEKLRKEEEKTCRYRLETRKAMLEVVKETFGILESYADTLLPHDIDLTTLNDFTSNKVLTLLELLKKAKDEDQEKRTIVFVEQKFTAEALTHLIMDGSG